ncbi:hypothetical protein OsI_36517 [Oryza sativa Indica Group]|uniref:Uncharacterized protein n=1 Tax=Oryza sativa subsp. indica TaxID=39946 RepID=A2ZFG0_ORYSI|nr:hypothetical protein OsI_36517 [Oryza sativa Indica Group]
MATADGDDRSVWVQGRLVAAPPPCPPSHAGVGGRRPCPPSLAGVGGRRRRPPSLAGVGSKSTPAHPRRRYCRQRAAGIQIPRERERETASGRHGDRSGCPVQHGGRAAGQAWRPQQEYTLLSGARGDVGFLQSELGTMNAALLRCESLESLDVQRRRGTGW